MLLRAITGRGVVLPHYRTEAKDCPFSNVYLHGLIRDSQGKEKCSKTLGCHRSHIDTIAERLTSNKAFTNKLWNAGKFILTNLLRQDDTTAWEALWAHKFDKMESVHRAPLPECWVDDVLMLIKPNIYSSPVLTSSTPFRYIEASKARLYHSGDHSVASVSQAALLYIFENILKLLHPFMPFVTEELWQALPVEEALIVSALEPSNVRAEYAVEPAKLISASIVANPDVIQYISGEREVLALLSRLDLGDVNFVESPPGDANQSVHIVAGEGLEAYLPLSDMVDISAEVQRLSKRLVKIQAEYDGLMARLSSSSFVESSPRVLFVVSKKKQQRQKKS
ncbi:hypothetical protein HAX54_044042 [Datura stramonium]|uniref:valine--tRNA ligase n=1 Tax=Datura stramonium TaxID=4076 RepID=A0ABS8SPB5_DATST|nr:hypothetical protein [Datura stramonium]